MLRTNHHLEELETELEQSNLKWDILRMAETSRKGEQLIQLDSGSVFYAKRGDSSNNGTGFLVNKRIQPKLKEYVGINDRISRISIELDK